MIEWLVFLMTGTFAGIVLSLIISIFKVGPGKPEFNFFKCLGLCCAITLGGPFLFVEIQTKKSLPGLEPTVKHYFENESELQGEVSYIKVLFASSSKATVYMICDEPQDWGGSDHPVSKLTMVKKSWVARSGKKFEWKVEDEQILRSDRLNKDSIVWPPYQ